MRLATAPGWPGISRPCRVWTESTSRNLRPTSCRKRRRQRCGPTGRLWSAKLWPGPSTTAGAWSELDAECRLHDPALANGEVFMKALGIAIALGLVATPALADWQYTNWGMSRAQVIAASRGAASLVEGRPGERVFDADLGAAGSYSAQGFEFSTQFFFDAAGRLKAVKLNALEPERCEELLDRMLGLYGNAGGRDRFGAKWTDLENGNAVRVTHIPGRNGEPDVCFAAYSSLAGSGAQGL